RRTVTAALETLPNIGKAPAEEARRRIETAAQLLKLGDAAVLSGTLPLGPSWPDSIRPPRWTFSDSGEFGWVRGSIPGSSPGTRMTERKVKRAGGISRRLDPAAGEVGQLAHH